MNGKNKIAMLTTTFFPQVGGAEYQVKWLAEELSKNGNEVSLFTPYEANGFIESYGKYPLVNISLRKKDTNVFQDGSRMLYRFISNVLKIKPDIIHAHFAFSSGFLAVITKPIHKAPVVITSHGEDIQLVESIDYGLRRSKIKSYLIKFTLRYCDKHVLVSNSMKNDALCSGSSENKIEVIHNIFNPPNIEITNSDEIDLKAKYGIKHSSKIILSVSRLHLQKGLNYLIEAMVTVLDKHPTALLVIAGTGPEKENLERLCQSKKIDKNVIFLGYITDKEKLILTKACDIFCLPAIEEAFGIALFDPMYFSKNIVATNVGGIPEVLGNDKMLVPKMDSVGLANAIIDVFDDDKNTLQYSTNQLETFYPNSIVKQYSELYRSLLR
ncbi:glycosyltransferase involved in cell wall biosynthesis [Methanohalophilus levihalophilus]|uniref:glycosyltransferase family 4 protein n=1 Tax=Methanohalophilus levihalophilus TaxID=1431282 RepID=UPI001AEA46C5|nr:glycosyltransferase family 4 protein [Methanohalophilus levihalophilus]MBP2029964.1 glycosyltransferase involved in cell wall biosynthesis [Methanohalophilus levihalophilus]